MYVGEGERKTNWWNWNAIRHCGIELNDTYSSIIPYAVAMILHAWYHTCVQKQRETVA